MGPAIIGPTWREVDTEDQDWVVVRRGIIKGTRIKGKVQRVVYSPFEEEHDIHNNFGL